jgi:hypothetical protein
MIFLSLNTSAKAQERKDGSTEDPIIILLIQYSGVKRILREGNGNLKISLGDLGVLV